VLHPVAGGSVVANSASIAPAGMATILVAVRFNREKAHLERQGRHGDPLSQPSPNEIRHLPVSSAENHVTCGKGGLCAMDCGQG